MNESPELLTVDEVAVFLRTSAKAIRNMMDRGQLPGVVKVGRRRLVRRDELRDELGLLPCPPPGEPRMPKGI